MARVKTADVITKNLLGGLKDLYMNTELSDRVLHIFEIPEDYISENYTINSSSVEQFSLSDAQMEATPNKRKLTEDKPEQPLCKKNKDDLDILQVSTTNEMTRDINTIKKEVIENNSEWKGKKNDCESADKIQCLDLPDNSDISVEIKNEKIEIQLENAGNDNEGVYLSGFEIVPFAVMPVHAIVLSLNSEYFRTLFSVSGMKEIHQKYITIKVNIGEGQYLEKLIHAFYDQTVLRGLTTPELLQVLQVADRFSCVTYIEKCISLLKKANITSFSECNDIIEHLGNFERKIARFIGNKCVDIEQCCVKFMVKRFCPLENKIMQHDNFLSITYKSLLLLLRSHLPFTWKENSVLTFLACWLDYDEARQKEDIVETLFKEINHKYLTPAFLFDEITVNHHLLSKWSGYKTWFMDVLAFHAFSDERKSQAFFQTFPSRNFKSNLKVPGWLVKFETIGSTSLVLIDDNFTIYQGYNIKPRLFLKDCDEDTYKITLHITHSNPLHRSSLHTFKFNFTTAIAVLPNYETYAESQLFSSDCAQFIKHHFRQVEVEFKSNTDYFECEFAYVTKDLWRLTDGFQVAMAFKDARDKWPYFMKTVQKLDHNKPFLSNESKFWQWQFDAMKDEGPF